MSSPAKLFAHVRPVLVLQECLDVRRVWGAGLGFRVWGVRLRV